MSLKNIILIGLTFICTRFCYGQASEVINYHVHVFSNALITNIENQGQKLTDDVYEVTCQHGECSEIKKIKAHNGDKLVLISGPYAFKEDYQLKDSVALISLVQYENDLLKDLVNTDRKNLYGFCGINPNWDFALSETKRCIEDLEMDGIKLHFQCNKININDSLTHSKISEILKYLSNKDRPVLIHLNGTDLYEGQHIAQDFIKNFLNNADEQTIIFAHSGGPGGLTSFNIEVLKEFDHFFKTNKYNRNKKIYFELSGAILKTDYPEKLEPAALKDMIIKIGSEHFLFGSDYPFQTGERYLKVLEEDLGLNPITLRKIKTNNIFMKK
ncbi:MAG: amidohydrolase family protein [Saprospiraceae bacterium]